MRLVGAGIVLAASLAAVALIYANGCAAHNARVTKSFKVKDERAPKFKVPAYVLERQHDEERYNECRDELLKYADGFDRFLQKDGSYENNDYIENYDIMCSDIQPGTENHEGCYWDIRHKSEKHCDLISMGVERNDDPELDVVFKYSVTGTAKDRGGCNICITTVAMTPASYEGCRDYGVCNWRIEP